MNILDELAWRGAINQVSDEEGLRKLLDKKRYLHSEYIHPLVALEHFRG